MLTPRHRRAVPIVAAAWALVWAALSPLVGAGLLLWAPTSDAPFALWLRGPLHGAALVALGAVVMAVRGAVSGAAFAVLLSYLERGRRADELSAARLVLWANVVAALWTAGLAGLARLADPGVPIGAGQVLLSFVGTGVLATVAALVTLWLVRRGGAPGGGGRGLAGVAGAVSLPSGAAVPQGVPSASRAAEQPG